MIIHVLCMFEFCMYFYRHFTEIDDRPKILCALYEKSARAPTVSLWNICKNFTKFNLQRRNQSTYQNEYLHIFWNLMNWHYVTNMRLQISIHSHCALPSFIYSSLIPPLFFNNGMYMLSWHIELTFLLSKFLFHSLNFCTFTSAVWL